MKRKLLFAAMLIAGALGGQLRAQMTDVTSTYIKNPSFELGTDGTPASTGKAFVAPYSWTATDMPSSGTHNFTILTENETSDTSPSAFGTTVSPSDGTYYYFARHSWSSSLTTTLTQTSLTALPAGQYLLTIDYKVAKSSGDLNPKGYMTMQTKQGETLLNGVNSAISASQNVTYFNTAAWTTLRVPFKVTSEGNVDFIITFNFNPSSVNIPQEAIIIDNVRLLKADNPATPVADNTKDLYFLNEQTGQYLSAGATWGTHAIVDNTGQPVTAKLSNGVYTLATQEYGKYVSGLYMDAGVGNWLLLETSEGSGKYYMTQDGVNYMTSNGAGAELINVTTPTEASVWSIISKADRKKALSSATIDSPANATFLLADPNFGRNNTAYSSWTWTFPNGENKDNSGDNTNFVVECFQKQFTFKQTLAAGTAPAGVYALTAQGFYRQDGKDNDNLPVFFANNETQTFPIRGAAAENSMSAASTSFLAGNYTAEPIYVRIENTDAFEIGAKLETNEKLWCIWDNFQLTYYGDVTVAAVKMKASVDAYNAARAEAQAFTEASMFAADWNALQNEISSNVIDLNDPDLTESALNTATANLVAANEAATVAVAKKAKYENAANLIGDGTADVDLTSLLGNPSFETTAAYALAGDGWVNEGVGVQGQTNTGFDGYRVGNVFAERWIASGSIGAFKTYQTVTLPAGLYKITAVATFNGNGASIFANGSEATITDAMTYTLMVQVSDQEVLELGVQAVSPTGSWFKADNFTLTYLADYPAYTLASGKMGTDKSAAQSAAESTFLGAKTVANYNALIAAIGAAEASVANYTALKAAIDKAEAVKEANNFVTADAISTFSNEIATATTAWTDVTYTDAQATSEITTLGSAVSGWHTIASEGKAGAYMTSAWSKTSENWWDAPYINTWSTEGDNDGSGFSVPFFEYFAEKDQNLPAKTMTATLTDMENGMYEVELWARVQRRSDADFNSDNSMITMKVNDGEAVSIMSNTSNNVGSETSVMRLGRYTAVGEVTDGTLTLTINVKLGANVHWLSWRDVKYTKLDEATMKISDAQYATFIAPFDVTIPEGVTAYTVDGVENNGSTLTLNAVETSIPANTPVVLYKETELAATTFYGKAVEADDLTEGLLTGVYTATEAPVGSYVLQNNDNKVGFYLVAADKEPTVGANRAYLTAPAAGGVKAAFFFDSETAIKDVFDGMQNGDIYDLSGRKVSRMLKGNVYIVNGQKVAVK